LAGKTILYGGQTSLDGSKPFLYPLFDHWFPLDNSHADALSAVLPLLIAFGFDLVPHSIVTSTVAVP
jgi:arginine/ornithine N-succinyltransferase beta subunit